MRPWLVVVLLVGCAESAPADPWRWVGDSRAQIEVPGSVRGAPTETGWRGATEAQTRCGPTVVTLETSAVAVAEDVSQEGMRCQALTHVRSIPVGEDHRVVRCVMNTEVDGLGAPDEPCARIVASLRPR